MSVTQRSTSLDGELHGLHLEVGDREAVIAGLDETAEALGLHRVPPETLVPFGRWLHGDEDPSVRRYLVSPPGDRWITVLPSATDWDHDWCVRVTEALDCRGVYLMLHDEDVFTLHLTAGAERVADHVSSPDYFDLAPRKPADLGAELDAILEFCAPNTSREELLRALEPPGEIDIDGRKALEQTAALLEIPLERATDTYRATLLSDGLTVRPEYSSHVHVTYRQAPARPEQEDEAPAEPDGAPGVVLPFRLPRGQ